MSASSTASTGPVRASAPGKIILFGEHAVVYGEPALGVPLSATVDVTLTPGRGRLGLELPEGVRLAPGGRAASPKELVTAALGPLAKAHDVAIELGVPPMAGLGSSAALAVALLRAAATLRGERPRVSELLERAIEVEGIAHGRSSGVDPAIALAGRPILYVRSKRGTKRITPIALGAPAFLVVGTRGGHGGTRGAVSGVASLKDAAPRLVEQAMKALGAATREGASALERGDLTLAGRVMDVAHGVLSGLGLVGPAIEEVVTTARAKGALGAKMSGAGGEGGAFVALASDQRGAARIAKALEALGARAWVEALGPA